MLLYLYGRKLIIPKKQTGEKYYASKNRKKHTRRKGSN